MSRGTRPTHTCGCGTPRPPVTRTFTGTPEQVADAVLALLQGNVAALHTLKETR